MMKIRPLFLSKKKKYTRVNLNGAERELVPAAPIIFECWVSGLKFLFFEFWGPFWIILLLQPSSQLRKIMLTSYLICPSCKLPQTQFHQNYGSQSPHKTYFFQFDVTFIPGKNIDRVIDSFFNKWKQ